MALIDNLTAYWKLDESSGNRSDSHGSITLTDNNTVLAATGALNNGADFEKSNSEYLSASDAAALSFGNEDFFISFWFKLESDSFFKILGKGGSNLEWGVNYQFTNDNIRFLVGNGAGTTDEVDSTVTLSLATLYHAVCWHTASSSEIGIRINDTTTTTATSTVNPVDGTGAFGIGSYGDSTFTADAIIDEVGLWRRAVTAQDITDLYGGGTPPAYPFSTAFPRSFSVWAG